jgi:hypothetical protein
MHLAAAMKIASKVPTSHSLKGANAVSPRFQSLPSKSHSIIWLAGHGHAGMRVETVGRVSQ